MKIPETSANVGAYYGNEENGQWQPNGVIIDNGVGGGVVGSGDAGIHRPPIYPVHIPRGHVPAGYVMAGAYYPPAYPPVPAPQDDFADYMWMENEEEFDKQVMQQLEEEALMEQCIEAMLEDEQRERQRGANRNHPHANPNYPTTSNGNPPVSLEEAVSRSTLNPLAAEFVPTRVRQPPPPVPPAEEKQETPPPEAPSKEQSSTDMEKEENTESKPEEVVHIDEIKTQAPEPPQIDPPEVSAADVLPIQEKPKKEAKKVEPKKPVKIEVKKAKPVVVKSETKVQSKKKEVKAVKSEIKIEDKTDVIVDVPAPQTPPVSEESSPPGPKPINYAAAAKATKPKPKSTTPPIEKSTIKQEKPKEALKSIEKVDKKPLQKEKSVPKEKSGVQRKNSTK